MDDRLGDALRRWGLLLIVGCAVLRCQVSIVPQVRFDVDPAINPTPYAGLGPAGSFALDIAMFLGSAAALWGERRAGRRIDGWSVLLAALPAIAIAWHGASDAHDLFRGATWLAAAFAAVATAHLARDPAARPLLFAGVLAVVAPVALRGLEQILHEHRLTVEEFRRTKIEFLTERGWTPDSAAAQSFERRLEQTEAIAWFGLANIVSAMMAFGALAWAGTLVATRKALGTRLVVKLAALGIALASLAILLVNGSKGAIGATVLAAAALLLTWRDGTAKRLVIALALCAIAAAVAPAVRGLLPEGSERSLLFRSHYLEGAVRALPESLPFGVGPDGFQDVYLRTKPAESPEDVTSVHSMALDWLLTLGPLGLAWLALVVRLGIAAARERVDRAPPRSGVFPSPVVAALAIACTTWAVQFLAEVANVSWLWALERGAGAVSFVGAYVVAAAVANAAPRAVRVATIAAIGAVLIQAQVEMIFFQPGAVAWALVALGCVGAAGAAPATASRRERLVSSLSVGYGAVAALAIGWFALWPQTKQDALMDEAIDVIRPLHSLRLGWPQVRESLDFGRVDAARSLLEEQLGAGSESSIGVEERQGLEAALTAADPVNAMMRALVTFDSGRRARAADVLALADRAYPANRTALDAAIRQLAGAGRRATGGARGAIADPFLHAQALEFARVMESRFDSARAVAMVSDLVLEEARQDPTEAHRALALEAARRAAERQPHSPQRLADYADALAAQGDYAAAERQYDASLAADDAMRLDPVMQLNPRARQSVEARRAAVAAAAAGTTTLPSGWPFSGSRG